MNKQHRLAVVDLNRCRPNDCGGMPCKKKCPSNSMGLECISIEDNHAKINEEHCSGCGICPKICPFGAIQIINLPTELEKDTIHRYGANGFKLFKLPQPRKGSSYALLGQNGVGKSTAVGILSFKTSPNFGTEAKLNNLEISKKFTGTYLQNYFKDNKKVLMKNQHLEVLTKSSKHKNKTIKELIDEYTEYGAEYTTEMIQKMDLQKLLNRTLSQLSGGEAQKLYCLIVLLKKAEVFIFDEFTNFLDISQRIRVANLIKENQTEENIIICVEHDLVISRYVSQYASILYGVPGAYGVVSMPQTISHAVNIFLDGYIPSENMRFREEPFVFQKLSNELDEIKIKEEIKLDKKAIIEQMISSRILIDYPEFSVKLGDFELHVDAGKFILNSGITLILGPNGIGKTLLLRVFSGEIKPQNADSFPSMNISYKPQHLTDLFMCSGDVRSYLHSKIGSKLVNPEFKTDVINTLGVDKLFNLQVDTLSGGQMQIIAIAVALGIESDLILIDEPSNMEDIEVRFKTAKAIKNFVSHNQKSVFVVDHDITFLSCLSNSIFSRIIVFDGEPGVKGHAYSPVGVKEGMNLFLKQMNITMRPDKHSKSGFCKINKPGSRNDSEQKKSGNYFIIDE